MRKLLSILFVTLSVTVYSQRLGSQAEVEAKAIESIEQGLSADGDITKFVKSNGIKGSIKFEITLSDKGRISSIQVLESEGMTIPHKNDIKNFLYHRNFKLKSTKGSRYGFEYAFNF